MGKQHKQPAKTPKVTSVADAVEAEVVRSALEKRRAGQHLSVAELAAVRRYEKRHQAEQRLAAYRAVPQTELVPMLATTRKTLLEWEAAGLPVNREAHPITYDLFKILPWLKQRWLVGTEPGTKSKRDAEIDLLVARKVHLELKTRLATGQLLDRADVERGRCERIKMVRVGLQQLGRALAPAVLELDKDTTLEEAEALIWSYVKPLLAAFAASGAKHAKNENTPEARGK